MPQLFGQCWPELPAILADGSISLVRTNKYGEMILDVRSNGITSLSEDGVYFKAMLPLGTAAIALSGASQGAFVTTTPTISIRNSNGAAGKSIFLDYVRINITAAAATTPTRVEGAVTTDSTTRYSSGGTAATNYNTSMASATTSGVVAHGGAITATNAVGTTQSRFVLLNSNPIAGSSLTMQFGAAVGSSCGDTVGNGTVNCPPISLAPNLNATCLIYLWWPGLSVGTAATGDFEIAFWEK